MEVSIYTWKRVGYIEEKVEELQREFPKLRINVFESGETKDYRESEYIVAVDMTRDELEGAQKLKGIFVPYTGLNEFPVDDIRERGIEIEGSHAKAKYVAEKGLGLLLGVMGRVCEYDVDMRRGIWGPRSGVRNHWESLHHKRIGMLGAGHIGQEFMRLAEPFTTKFAALDRGKRYSGIDTYYGTLRELAQNVDILFMSLPLTKTTEGMIDEEILREFEGYIINVGRGRTIDERALYEALKEKRIKGAGIEVWYNYPKNKGEAMPSEYPFHELKNIVMSPHIATNNIEDRWIYFEDAFNKLREVVARDIG